MLSRTHIAMKTRAVLTILSLGLVFGCSRGRVEKGGVLARTNASTVKAIDRAGTSPSSATLTNGNESTVEQLLESMPRLSEKLAGSRKDSIRVVVSPKVPLVPLDSESEAGLYLESGGVGTAQGVWLDELGKPESLEVGRSWTKIDIFLPPANEPTMIEGHMLLLLSRRTWGDKEILEEGVDLSLWAYRVTKATETELVGVRAEGRVYLHIDRLRRKAFRTVVEDGVERRYTLGAYTDSKVSD